jgi:hypothetical protein
MCQGRRVLYKKRTRRERDAKAKSTWPYRYLNSKNGSRGLLILYPWEKALGLGEADGCPTYLDEPYVVSQDLDRCKCFKNNQSSNQVAISSSLIS